VLTGARAGAEATVAMSAVMLAARRVGLLPKQPPQQLAETAGRRLLGWVPETSAARRLLGAVNHLAVGVAAGAAYAAVRPRSAPEPASGLVYGLGVWLFGYAGVMPALGALPPAHRDDRSRVAVMVGAHVVYGVALGWRLRPAG
jgi:hypothetical protein